jgi:signal transduction histidine kinase/DNA-binding NarL/FixJ family response regulator
MNQVVDIKQTEDGYLWLATFGGIARFDGQRFVVYDAAEHPVLPSSRFHMIEIAPDGAVIAQTEFGHIVRLYEGEFELLVPGEHLAGNVASGMWRDDDGRLWIGTSEDVGMVEGDSIVSVFPSPPGWRVRVALPAFGQLWVGTQDGRLHSVSPQGTRTVAPLPGSPLGYWAQVSGLEIGPDGHLYVGTFNGLFRLDLATDSLEKLHVGDIADLSLSPDRTRLVATGGYLLEIDRDGQIRELALGARPGSPTTAHWSRDGSLWYAHEQTVYRDGEPIYETASWVDAIFEDAEGSVWIGEPGGLVQLTPTVFRTYAPPESIQRAACSDQPACAAGFGVYAIAEEPDHGRLWVGTLHHGTWRLSQEGSFEPIDSRGSISLYAGREGVLRGGYRTGLCQMDDDRCEVVGSGPSIVRAIIYDDEGTLWVGTDHGLLRYRGQSQTSFGRAEGLPHEHVFSIVAEPDGTIWLGTLDGVARIREGRVEAFGGADGLDTRAVRALRLENGVLWAGTESRGLFRIQPGDGPLHESKVTHYGTEDGLHSDGVHAILSDGYGRIWMSSNQGIFWVDQKQLEAFAEGRADRVQSVVYLERDGLHNREANGGSTSAGLRASDGRLWFATMGGAAVVDPASVDLGRHTPRVVIEAVRSGIDHLDSSNEIVLEPDQRDFEVDYTAPSFLNAANLRFRYRLDGYDADWVDAGMRRTAFYTNVPAGRHVFRVAAAADDGSWSEANEPLMIRILPRYYEQPWFLPLIALSSLGLAVLVLRRREGLHTARARELSGLVRERTAQLEAEKEQSERARSAAERAETTAREALIKVADQAHRLEELDHAKSRFFANISHELRTPLTLTIGPLEDLREGMHGAIQEEARQEIDLALRNSHRLLRLVNQILDVAKLEAGQLQLRPMEIDLAELVTGVAQAFRPLAERRNISFTSEGLDAPLPAILDPDQFEKIVLNLLSNAFKFTASGGSVRIALTSRERPGSSSAVLAVVDSGVGIPEELQKVIFERFYQGHERPESSVPGTGIGLSLVRELVELHGGRIDVLSAPDEGSTFTVEVPTQALEALEEDTSRRPNTVVVEPPPTKRDSGDLEPADPDTPDPRLTILIVDDHAEIRQYARKHLSGRYRVIEAVDGKQGFDLAREHTPDLVLSDVMMPGMTGDELCRAIKADSELDFVPVVLLTAKASQDSRIQGLSVGADDYLTKPFSMRELRARIENLIGQRQRLRDRMRKAKIVSTGTPADATSVDERFLANVRRVILERLADEDFGVEALAEALGQSRAHLYRRLGELQDRSPAELIRLMRLDRGAELLRARAGTVSEVAYAVGFKSVSHFSRAFRRRYDVTPSECSRRAAGPDS